MKNILVILIALSVAAMAEFSRLAAGVVTDSATGLQWQDDYSDNNGTVKTATWIEAIDYCENLSLDGGGWRLPNIRELNSIVDLAVDPAIDPVFVHTASYGYWSATTLADFTDYAWYVYFNDGYRNSYYKRNDGYVRCVRSRQPE